MNTVTMQHASGAAGPPFSWRALTNWPVLGWLLRRGYLMTGLRTISFLLLLAVIGLGLFTEDSRVGLSVLLTWGVFWPLLTSVVTPTLGNAFCAVCPLGFAGKWLSRVGLRRSFPRRLRGVWIGLLAMVLGYWLIAFAMPTAFAFSTRTTAIYFLLFTLASFAIYYVYRDMAWCKHVCPLGRVTATHGKVGVLQIATDTRDCATCRTFDCAKACSYHLSPFRFEQRNNMDTCTLCADCVTACDSVHLVAKAPGAALRRPIAGQDRHDAWVFLTILAVAGVGVQFEHNLRHTALREHLPWNIAGQWLHGVVPFEASTFDLGRLLSLIIAVVLTFAIGVWAYRRAAAVAGTGWGEAANSLSCALAPLAVLALIPHAVSSFATFNAHSIANETGALLGASWTVDPLARRGDAWLGWMGVLAYAGMAWTLWLVWVRAGVLAAVPAQRVRLWFYGSLPAWLFIAVYLCAVGAKLLMAAGGHAHH